MIIEKHEEAIKSSQTEAKSLLEQAHLLMEDWENVNISRKSEKRVQQSIIKLICQKIVRKQHLG